MKLKQFIFALVAMLSGFAFTANAQVAKVGNTEYATIDEAISNWTSGTTLTLLADVQLSRVVKINSNESRTLDLGTFTMTAAKNQDAFQYVVTGSTSDVGLSIKADATNPGGINASGKAIIRHTKPLFNAPSKDRPYTQFFGGVFNASYIVYQGGTLGTGYTGASAPRFVFHGGEFNGTIYANRSKFIFNGGTFNGDINISVDSSADALVKGGKFKNLSNKFSSDLNDDKFTIGSAAGVYDRGIYVDKDGYYVITSAPITEVSAKYPAVKKEDYNRDLNKDGVSDIYFYYSAANTYGMFYEVASMAGTGSDVTVWEPVKAPAVEEIVKPEATEEEKAVVEEVIAEVTNNAAVKNNTVELPAEVVDFAIELAAVEVAEETTPEAPEAPVTVVTEISYTVTPSNAAGEKVSKPSEPITFRLPLPSNWASEKVKVFYNGTALDGDYTVMTENGAKYVEVESQSFSTYTVKAVVPLADYVVLPAGMDASNYETLFGTNTVTDGTNYYATLQAAVEAVAGQANAVLYCKPGAALGNMQHAPVVSTLTVYGNGANVTGFEHFDLGNTDPNGGRDITADMTLTIKNLNGYSLWGAKATAHTANVVIEDCADMGKVFISGTTGTLNITINDSEFKGRELEAVYSNADGAITLNNVAFSNLNKAINLNHKAAGTQTVTINGCSFTNCGADVAADQIPVRVLSSVEGGKSVLNVSNATFSGTPTGGADILLDYGVGLTEATVASTTANVVVENENNVGTKTEVSEGNSYEFTTAKPVASINGTTYMTLAEAAAAAQSGDEIVMLADVTLDAATTLPAGITFNGNGKQINGTIVAAGDITFAGVTKAGDLDFAVGNTVVNIPAGASLQLNGSARMSIGFGTTFNIVGTIEDAKTADKATVVPSLVIPGASFSGAGVKFNVTNAYISVPSSYCSTSKTASGTFDFNITNSIWESAGKLAFEEQSVNAKVDFALVNSVLTTGSHLVFGTASGEEGVVIDNSYVNKDTSRQLENCGTMTIKNGSVVNGAVATSSNAKNPGTVIVENATYAVTGEFSGSDLGTGTLIIKKGANVSVGSITTGANITVDAEGMTASDVINFTANLSKFAGTLSVINNDKLEAQIVDGKVVLAAKPVAKIGEQGYATLDEAFAAAAEGETITLLDDATPALTSQRAITKAAVIDLGGKTLTLTEDDLYFGTTTFKNGTIVVDPSVKASTAVFWMFANQTLTFDNVKIVATGVTGTYLIGLDGNNSDLNLLNGSEILVENTTALDLDIICVNASTGNDIKVENSKVNVTNLDGRVFFRGNYTVKDSEVNLAGITKAGFRIEAGQTLSIEGTSVVNIEGEPRDGGIHMTDLSATYTKAETATVNATLNRPAVAKIGDTPYYSLSEAVAAAQNGETITLVSNIELAEVVTIPAGKTLTIDLNGKAILMKESIIATAYAINNLGNLTIKDGVGGGSVNARGMYNGYGNGGENVASATITILGGTFNAKGTNGGAAIFNYGTANVNGGKFTSIGGYSLNNQAGAKMNITDGVEVTGGIYNNQDAELTVDGGNISNNRSGCHTIYAWNAKVTVNGGSIHNENSGNATIMSAGTSEVTINGGTISIKDGRVPGNGNTWTSCLTDAANTAKIIVNGGTFNGGVRVQSGATMTINGGSFNDVYGSNYNIYGTVTVTGGTFTDDTAKTFASKHIAAGYELGANGTVVQVNYVAQIGEKKYVSLADALEATKTMTGDVTVEILDKVTFNQPLIGSYSSINFVGKAENAEMYLDVQGYTTATGKKVSFTDLKLSKSEGGFIANAGFMNVAFGIYDVEEVTYTNCTFENGACASSGKVTFNGCTFKKSWDKYGLWAYGNVDVTVQGSTFADYRGIKMYAENGADASVEKANLTVKNTNFSAVNNKPAIVLTYGESVVLEGNTYSSTGTFELDLDGKPNGVAVTSDVAPVCVNDNGACGVLVDGKIYTTVAQAAEVATSGSNVTLLHNSAETVELAEGVVLDKNGFEAAGVTVAVPVPVAKVGDVEYTTLAAAVEAAQNGETIILIADVELTAQVVIPEGKVLTLDLNGKTVNSVFNGNSTTNHIYALSNKGTLTINDSKGNGSINSRGIYNYGSLTLNAGAINAIDGNGGYAVNNQSGSTFVMNGGVVAATNEDDHQSSSGGYDATALKVPAGCTATLNGGTINNVCDFTYAIEAKGTLNIPETSTITVNGTHGAIYVSDGETTINAGTFQIPADEYTRTDNVLYVSGGSLVINGGTFIGDSDTAAGGSCLSDAAGKAVVNGGTFKGSSGGDVWGTTGTTIKGGTFENLTEKQHIADGYELGADGTVKAKPVVEVNGVKYASFAEATAAAQAGDEIKLLANIEGDITVPANVTLNGNGFAISGGIFAEGDITFAGVTTAADFDANVAGTAVNIPAGASLQLTGSARLVIGHGATFNITGTIEDAKTADKATLVPSLKIAAGASITGNGVTFNVNNAYIVANANTTSKNSNANGTLDFNINNSIWEQTGVLAFYVPTSGKDPVVNFELKNSVLTTTSHLVFSVTKGEIVFDNSLVNQGTARQLENRSTMTIKNGSVVNGAVATSSNAINPGTIIVENATYAVTGEFSGAAEGTGTLVIKKGANVSVGSIKAGANVTVDADGMAAGDEINFTANLSQFTGTLSVINNDKLEAKIVDGKVVLAAKPVAMIGEQGYATLEAAFAAATEGQTITMLDDATPALASQRAITKAAVIDLGGKTLTLTEDDLYFGTTTFKNGTIVVDPSVKPSTAVFWMFANQTLTFDAVKVVATGVTGTYLIGLDGNNSDLNLLNGSEILVENTTALDLDIICVNASTGNDIKVENSKVNVTNLDGRVFFRGNYTVKDSEVNLAGITKAGFRIEAGQKLSIEGTSKVNIEGEPRDGGIHLTDASANYTKAETATVNATVNEPKVAKIGETTYKTLQAAIEAVQEGETIILVDNVNVTTPAYGQNALNHARAINFTLDLNGKTLSANTGNSVFRFNIANSGATSNVTLTIKNGKIVAGSNTWCAVMASGISSDVKAIMNLENLTIEASKAGDLAVKAWDNATINANNVTVNATNAAGGFYAVGGEIVLDNCTVNQKGLHTAPYLSMAFAVSSNGKMTINSGTYSAEPTAAAEGSNQGSTHGSWVGGVMNSGGELIINGGTFSNDNFGDDALATAARGLIFADTNGKVTVNGGTFNALKSIFDFQNNLGGTSPVITVKGGDYSADPAKVTSYGSIVLDANCVVVENNGVWNVVKAVAKVGDKKYATLEDAFKAATSGCTIDILSDVTVDYNWDARYTGGKFTVPVTINGNGKTIKFTASVNDNNYQAPFRFEADATVKNLTIDMSEVTDNRFRAISSKGNLAVDSCKFIGKDESLNCRAIIFGEGAGANVGNLVVAITNSEFINWKRGITDNENAQDVKTVTITGNTLTDAGVGVSAKETVTFTGNTVSGAYVNIKSYTAGNKLAVTATGNTLEANTETAYNVIDAGGVVNAEGFKVVAKGGSMIGYTSTEGIYGEVWGNSRESFVIKVVDAQGNVMGTTSLNNVGGIIDGDVYVTWNIKFNAAANTDEYWTMAWTTAPSIDNMPAKVQLWVDGTNVSEGDVVLNGPDNLWPIAVAVTDAEGNILSCHETIAAAVAANATNIALLRDTDEVIKLPLGVTLDKNGFTADGVTVTLPVAKIGEHNFASVNDALAYAKEAGLTNLEITIIGTNDASTTDSFDLVYTTLFDNVTIKQENGGVAYYIYDLYTGSRTNAGQFVFDGVNIVVTDQYMFEGNVKLSNNSLIKSVAEANCFVYNAEVTVEAGSKIDGVIEDIRGGSLIIDGGKTDGTYCETPGLRDAILVVNWVNSNLVLRNGAYVNINAANEIGRLTVTGTLDVTNSKLDSYQWIEVNGSMKLNAGSLITTQHVKGAGNIIVDATGLEGTVTVINGDMAGFTGAIEVVGNDYAKYEITEAGLVINSSYIAELEIIDGEYGNYINDGDKTVGKLTYVRTLPAAGIWYPVFLPFDVPVGALAENFDVARINDLHTDFSEEDGSIKKMWIEYIVRKSGTLAAGKPFLVRAKSSEVLDMEIELENVTLYASSKKNSITVSSAITKVTFEGVYEATSGLVSTPSTRYMAVNANGVWDEFDGYPLNPFRVLMTLEILDEEYYVASAASLSVGARVIGEENEDGTTTIYDVEADREENDMIFDLQGRRVLETEKGGIYIKNGKKFIVK